MVTKILFVGIGGVGGYFGGKMAHYYAGNPNVEIHFLARGNHLDQINSSGLVVHHLEETFTAIPSIASSNAADIGECDYVFFATKNYSLHSVVAAVLPCIGKNTKIITLLNGVSSVAVLNQIFTNNEVLNGCVYILSKIQSPGVIENFGSVQKMSFGRDKAEVEDLRYLEKIILDAGIDLNLSSDILEITWSKFVFISAVGTASSFFNTGLGDVLNTASKRTVLVSLLEEVSAVAKAKGIALKSTIVWDVVAKLERLPADTTSSMQRDFQDGNQTEVDALTKYVMDEGKTLGVDTPTYDKLWRSLQG